MEVLAIIFGVIILVVIVLSFFALFENLLEGRRQMKKQGKVFLDSMGNPFYVAQNINLLCRWSEKQRCWITLREVKDGETFPDNLTEEEQLGYFD